MPKLVQSIADFDNIILAKQNIVKDYSVEISKKIQNFGQKKKLMPASCPQPETGGARSEPSTSIIIYHKTKLMSTALTNRKTKNKAGPRFIFLV